LAGEIHPPPRITPPKDPVIPKHTPDPIKTPETKPITDTVTGKPITDPITGQPITRTTIRNTDGTVTIKTPHSDGSTISVTTNPDKSVTTITKDVQGNTTTQHTTYKSDGTIDTNVSIKNGERTTTINNPDKTVTTINPDKSVSVKNTDNSITSYDSNGNITSFKGRDGHLTDATSIKNDTEVAAAAGTKNSEAMSTVKDWMNKNPGTTMAVALGSIVGVAGMAYAWQQYQANNNKTLTITSSKAGSNSGDVVITYSPNTTIRTDDKITLVNTNFVLNDGSSPNNQQFPVVSIQSDTTVTINIPNIQTYANSGTFTLQTTLSNQVWGNIAGTAGSISSGVFDTVGAIFSPITNFLKPYMLYLEIFCAIICCLIITMIFWKIYKMFGGGESHYE
jgi:hypothetical protein